MNNSHFIYDRVYILGIDGAGNFFTKTDTPNIDKIFKNGAVNHNVLTSIPTISAQCWGSMLHGVSPKAHRLTNSIVDRFPLPENFPYPSVFKIARAMYPEAKLSSVSNWEPINRGIIENNLNVIMETGDDDEVCRKVIDTIINDDPKLLFVQFDSVDGAGHKYGYGFKGHLDRLTYVDSLVGKIYDAAEKENKLENTLFIVTADHGGTPDGSHGDNTDAEKYVSFFATGKTVKQGYFGYMEIRDTASIVAYALGIEQPENWSSRVPDDFFTDCIPFKRKEEDFTKITKKYSDRKTLPTPTQHDKKLENFIDTQNLICCFNFDGNLTETIKNRKTEYIGKLYFTDGFYSQCATLDDCVIKTEPINFNNDDFTFSAWIKKPESENNDEWCVFSTKDDENDNDIGFGILTLQMELKIRIGLGDKSIGYCIPLPVNYQNNWFHLIVTVSRKNSEISVYYDFEKDSASKTDIAIPENLILNGNNAHFGNNTPISIDDILIFNKKLTDNEIGQLQKYYEQN